MRTACLYVRAPCACSAQEGQKRASDLLQLELPMVVSHCVCVLGTELGPLKEQKVLLTTGLSL